MQSIRYRWIITFSFIWSWLVITLGAFTRLTDSGLSCPDWPGCYGKLYVGNVDSLLANFRIWAEMVHRYAAGVLTLSILLTLWVVYVNRDRVRPLQWFFAAILGLLLLYQPILGMWTVTLKLHPSIVSQHLLSGMSLMVLIAVQRLYFSDRACLPDPGSTLRWMGVVALVLLYLQLLLGAWTSTNYAALSCDGFPFCHAPHWDYQFKEAFNFFQPLTQDYSGGVISENARRTIQVVHRFGALVVGLWLCCWATAVMLSTKFSKLIINALLVLALVLTQVVLGIAIVYFAHPLGIAIFHTLSASALLLAVVALNFRLWRRPE